MGAILHPKIKDEAVKEGINFYRKWQQQMRNGILPIGIAAVGKTTLLSRFDVEGQSLFLNFNRTMKTSVNRLRLRSEFIEQCNGVEYFGKIDVPGELPEEWAKAYFDHNPRILLVMVDQRSPDDHLPAIRKFMSLVQAGGSIWQKAKRCFTFRRNNLARILFVVNKIDQIEESGIAHAIEPYKALLADLHSLFNASIQVFKVSLDRESEEVGKMFDAALDGLARK